MKMGAMIAKDVPPPDQLEEAGEGEGPGAEAGDSEAAELSAMEAFMEAVKGGSPEEALAAFKDALSICGY